MYVTKKNKKEISNIYIVAYINHARRAQTIIHIQFMHVGAVFIHARRAATPANRSLCSQKKGYVHVMYVLA